jgi:hypothetical protein
MAIKSVIAKKSYEKDPFLLTEAKLSRIVEIARDRLNKARGDKEIVQGFKVSLSNNKEIETIELPQVFSLDNSIKNPIVNLSYTASIERSIDNIGIDFSQNGIDIIVRSEDFAWRNETIGAIEEQVDRVIQRGAAYKLTADSFPRIIMLLLAILSLFTIFFDLLSDGSPKTGRLSREAAAAITFQSTAAVTDSQKLDVVFAYVKAVSSPGEILDLSVFLSTSRTYFIGVPALVTIVVTIFTLASYYPRRVFAWGDWSEHYENLVERRKFMWGSVVVAMLVSVLSIIFGAGLFPPK